MRKRRRGVLLHVVEDKRINSFLQPFLLARNVGMLFLFRDFYRFGFKFSVAGKLRISALQET